MKRFILLFFLSIFISVPLSSAHAMPQPIVMATLYSETTAVQPGQSFRIGVMLTPQPGWHTYWQNPGDAGLAPQLKWELPEGFSAGTIDWPAPKRMEEGPLVVHGYDGQVFLPVSITPPDMLAGESVTLKVHATWLVCKDICIPEEIDLEIMLPVGQAEKAKIFGSPFALHDVNKPIPVALPGNYSYENYVWHASIPMNLLDLEGAAFESGTFFIRETGVLRYDATQDIRVDGDMLYLNIGAAQNPAEGTVHGVLTVVAGGTKKHFDIAFAPGKAPLAQTAPVPSAPVVPQQDTPWLPWVLLLAVAGGVILNLMPCVLPVLSLKALAIAKKAGHEQAHVRMQGLTYTAGILVSFAVIAGILLSLRATGDVIGWGYQMQSPAFVGFLIYLLFLVGLSLSGIFHLPVLFGNAGGVTNMNSTKGSFLTGVLATAVATPCTAPFMATAVGAALTLPAVTAMLIFLALGFGLALPFLLISFFPPLLRLLPKPGAWMETFKELLAFPMYASAIWLLWVLTLQTGASGLAIALGGMLCLVIAIWMKRIFTNEATYRFVALILAGFIFVFSLSALSRLEMQTPMLDAASEHNIKTVAFSQELLDSMVAEGKPVFVDATAAWCITCQVNARIAIHTDRTTQAFQNGDVTLMIADWTSRNEEITRFLASFGHQGVPLYVYYPPNGAPKVLPQLLTEDIVIDAIQ